MFDLSAVPAVPIGSRLMREAKTLELGADRRAGLRVAELREDDHIGFIPFAARQ